MIVIICCHGCSILVIECLLALAVSIRTMSVNTDYVAGIADDYQYANTDLRILPLCHAPQHACSEPTIVPAQLYYSNW